MSAHRVALAMNTSISSFSPPCPARMSFSRTVRLKDDFQSILRIPRMHFSMWASYKGIFARQNKSTGQTYLFMLTVNYRYPWKIIIPSRKASTLLQTDVLTHLAFLNWTKQPLTADTKPSCTQSPKCKKFLTNSKNITFKQVVDPWCQEKTMLC